MMQSFKFTGSFGGGSGGDVTQPAFTWSNITGLEGTTNTVTFDAISTSVSVKCTVSALSKSQAGGSISAWVNGVSAGSKSISSGANFSITVQPDDTLYYRVDGFEADTGGTLDFTALITNTTDGGASLGNWDFTL